MNTSGLKALTKYFNARLSRVSLVQTESTKACIFTASNCMLSSPEPICLRASNF